VRGNSEADTRFLMYALSSADISGYLTGSTMPKLTQGNMNRISVLTPPLPEQRAIAHILGTLDDKIELNRRMNNTLETMARALFKSWFVDFDPVRAKAEGRDPGLPKPLADLFPDRFEDSELGQIPDGWSVGSLLRQATLLSGGTPKTDRREYWNGDLAWASATDVSQSGQTFLVETERSITREGLEKSSTQLIPALSSVVVARGATTGRLVILGREMAMNQTCYALTTSIDTPFGLYCLLRHEIDNLVHAAHGSVFDTITTATFELSRVVLPPGPALAAFEHSAAPLFHLSLANTEASRTLAGLRDGLLPKLISGELRVTSADRILAAHA
jgi:type I restriction enzyme S subunit